MARIVWYYSNNPFPPRGGADVRVAGLMELAIAEGHEILLVHYNPLRPDQHGGGVQSIRVGSYRGLDRRVRNLARSAPLNTVLPDPSALAHCRRGVDEFGPDVAVVSELFSWPIASRLLGQTPLVYDAHNFERDLHEQIRPLVTGTRARLRSWVNHRRITRIERDALAASRAVWAVSEDDRGGLAATCPTAKIWVAPNSCATPTTVAQPGDSGPNVLFVGNLSYEPNLAAIQALVEHVLPDVRRRCRDATLTVVGSHPTAALSELFESLDWAEIHANVPDLEPYYHRARAVVVPMAQGSGTNIKVFEAMSYGVPVVASAVAARGIPVADGEGMLIRDSAASIAEATLHLLQEPEFAALMGRTGRRVFTSRLSWSAATSESLRSALDYVAALPSN